MPILLDGNNLLHKLPANERRRAAVRKLVLEATRHEQMAMVVVFDGPPPAGAPAEEALGRVRVIYAGSRSADDVILARIPAGRAARQWIVVTDDRTLAGRARGLGAATRKIREWRSRPSPDPPRSRPEPKLSAREVAEWQTFFESGDRDDGD